MNDIPLKNIVEGLIMAAGEPLSVEEIFRILQSNDETLEIKTVREIINELVQDYNNRSLELREVASGWRFQVRHELSPWIAKLWEARPPRYSRAFLETLALIAYRQPITRAEIEEVRGVSVGTNIVKTLLEHEWVRVAGYKEVPGRPALYITTKKFLDHFNLKSLQDLPPLIEFTESPEVEQKIDAIVAEEGEGEAVQLAAADEIVPTTKVDEETDEPITVEREEDPCET